MAIDGEYHKVKNSGLPHHCYSQQMMDKHQEIKRVKGDIEDLLVDNSDHFSTNAKDAYSIGHTEALRVAREAGRQKDEEGLKRAYALDAFACHFLTDLFSSGHIRNERGELEIFLINQLGFSPNLAKPLAGALTAAQHEKDGNDGLNVINKRNERWRAYGDGNFFLPKNDENKQKVITAVQQSVNEIYDAWEKPDILVPSIVDKFIPEETDFNPLPVYSVRENSEGGKSLYLLQGNEIKEIKTKWDYINYGITHAANYLPEGYINGFLKGKLPTLDIPIPDIVKTLVVKVLVPGVTRLTGTVWNVVGIASFHQIQQGNQQLNSKIDEMAGILMATYDNTVRILGEIQKVHAHLDEISWNILIGEIKEPIATIKEIAHEHQNHRNTIDDIQRSQSIQRLWQAYLRLSSVFSGTTASGTRLLAAYESKLLKDSTNPMSPSEVKIEVTMWFRQMQEYQVRAYSLYVTLKLMMINGIEGDQIRETNLIKTQVPKKESNLIQQVINSNHVEQKQDDLERVADLERVEKLRTEAKLIKTQVSEIERNLIKQVEVNSEHIDQDLIYQSQTYIERQLANSKLKRLAHFEQLTNPDEVKK